MSRTNKQRKRRAAVQPPCLLPGGQLLCKLGSLAVHVDEATGPKGHPTDLEVAKMLARDPEVLAWLDEMRKLSLVPVKR